MEVEVRRAIKEKLNTDVIISALRERGEVDGIVKGSSTASVDKVLLNDAADIIEALVREKEKEGTMCAECANEDCHCDCAREFIPKVQVEKSQEAKMLMKEIERLCEQLKIPSPVGVEVIHFGTVGKKDE